MSLTMQLRITIWDNITKTNEFKYYLEQGPRKEWYDNLTIAIASNWATLTADFLQEFRSQHSITLARQEYEQI